MKYITDAAEAKEIDRISIHEIGIPSLVLMEKASMEVARTIEEVVNNNSGNRQKQKILSVCGMGNNGGDGVAAARILHEKGYNISILLVGDRKKATPEMETQLQIAEKLHMKIDTFSDVSKVTLLNNTEYNIIIDAIFGIGLSRDIGGIYAELINMINIWDAMVVAVDIASGVDASTGQILGVCVKADITVTFGNIKRGMLLFPGAAYSGEVRAVDIGFPKKAERKVSPKAYTYGREDIEKMVPRRVQRSNKGTYGKVLVIAGSEGMCGACYFAAAAAYRVGSGLVKILTVKENIPILQGKIAEAIISTFDELQNSLEWADVIAVGPGLGLGIRAQNVMDEIIKIKDKPVLIDADGLNILSEMAGKYPEELSENFVITPHLKEMSRLTGCSVQQIKDNLTEFAQKGKKGATIVLKDARTIVAEKDEIFINTTGNNGLSTGGSGDVLCGIITGLMAQGMSPFEAAKLGVCIHGVCADVYTEKYGRYSMLASDIIETLKYVMPF